MNEEEIMNTINNMIAGFIKADIPQYKKEDLWTYCKYKQFEAIQGLLDLYNKEKEKNKELDFENQALYESINCDNDNMLARRYQKIKEENDFLKLNGINLKVLMEMRKKFIAKDRLRELREIDNIDLIQHKIKELLEE